MLFLYALGVMVTVPLYWLVLPRGARRGAFWALSGAALVAYAPGAVGALAALTLAVHALLAGGSGARAVGAGALALGVLALHKLGIVRLVGVSYVAFRLVHVAIEVAHGTLAVGSAGETLAYALFPPAFLAGPIQRLPAFRAGADDAALELDDLLGALFRIAAGLAKKLLIVAPLTAWVAPAFAPLAAPGPARAWGGLCGYALIVYLDFSAYCDLAIGVARLYGFTLPENFAWPYGAASITEFWQRWHITLSTWLRDYVFLPVSVVIGRWPVLSRAPVLTGAVAAVVTMLVCGLWHGDTAAFVLWGAGHGLASAAHQVWRQKVVGALPARRRKALLAHPVYRAAATALTFVTVSLLWPLFRLDVAGALRYWRLLLP